MATLSEIRTQLRDELKSDRTGKIWADSTLNNYINKAILNLQIDGQFAWNENEAQEDTFSLTGSVQEYDLPTDFGQLELVILNDSNNEMYLKSTDFVSQRIRNLNASTSKPYNYFIRADKIGFDPIPDSGYIIKMYYRKVLEALVNDEDTFPFTDDFIQAVLKYGAFLAWSSPRGNKQTAIEKMADYNLEKEYLLQRYQTRDMPGLNYRVPRGTPALNNFKQLNYF